jgi:hypothetical protein
MKFKMTKSVGRNLTDVKLALLENIFGSASVIPGELVRILQIAPDLVMESASVISTMFVETPPIESLACQRTCKEVHCLAIYFLELF